MHQRAALVELSELNGCEAELFGQGCYGRDRVLVVARQKDDPMAALDDRVGSQGRRNQVIEAFHEFCAGDAGRDWLPQDRLALDRRWAASDTNDFSAVRDIP